MIMGFHDPDQLDSEKTAYKDRSDIAVFPLAIPLLAGPGTMTASLMFANEVHGAGGYAMLFGVIIAVQAIALAVLIGGSRLSAVFGPTGKIESVTGVWAQRPGSAG